MVNNLLLVALGGAIGSVLRFLCGRTLNDHYFPYGTLLVDILGCLIIGLLWGYFTKHINESLRLLLVMGFCGGFTTFSTFTYEGVHMIQQNRWLPFIFYTCVSVVGGLLATFAGYKITA
jgi:CrcB protein